MLSNKAFDRFIAELDKPAEPGPELVDLFKNNPNSMRRRRAPRVLLERLDAYDVQHL